MTTIAYRDGVLAADTLFNANDMRDSYGPKIFRVGKVLVGVAGSIAAGLRLRGWVESGMKGESPYFGTDHGNGIVASEAGVMVWSGAGCWPVREPFYALGSGQAFAIGAMAAGKRSDQAVRIAARFDIYTGGKVTILSANWDV